MKKNTFRDILFLILFFFYGVVEAQFTLIPDPNFEQFLEDNGMGDGITGNGQVLTANIENVTELLLNENTTNNNISDLTGIEDFTSLETFGCVWNPITEIDLSHNTNIKLLGIQYTLLAELDLSALENLQEIYINRNVNLTSVTLGDKPQLTYIDALENSIQTIDFIQCPVLETLLLQENYLTDLDISQNSNLEWLWCSINDLQELDTSHNPKLAILFSGHNNISHYDFSQNPDLYYFTEGYNNALTYVDVRNGNNEIMESFSIVQSFNLECIYVDDASAPYLEDWYIDTDFNFANNEEECNAMNTEEIFAKRIVVFPNPVKDKLGILNQDSSISQISIFDVSGKVIYRNTNPEKQIEIDFNGYSEGIYFIQADSKGKKFRTEKIVKN